MNSARSMPSLAVWAAVAAARAAAPDDPVAPWRAGVRIGPVSPGAQGHTIHSYFNTCPESPDGRWVLFFSSTARDGQRGSENDERRQSPEQLHESLRETAT